MSTYHDILGVSPEASQEEIKAAFRERALECHPDRADEEDKDTAQEEFVRVREAFEILNDENERQGPSGAFRANGTTGSEEGAQRSRGSRRSYKERWKNAEKVRVSKDIVDRVGGLSSEYRRVREKNRITIPVCAAASILVFLYDPLLMYGTGVFFVDFALCGLVGSVYGFALGSIWAYLDIFLRDND